MEAFFQKHSWRAHFSQCFPVSNTGNIVSSVSFCFQDPNYAYATRQGILTKIRACEHLQNVCEHEQARSHVIFASNSSKGQILRALPNWMGPFDTLICAVYKCTFTFIGPYMTGSSDSSLSSDQDNRTRRGAEYCPTFPPA